jgi:hypothetical protein
MRTKNSTGKKAKGHKKKSSKSGKRQESDDEPAKSDSDGTFDLHYVWNVR